MSGIYLIVYENTPVKLLETTKGGYPHITVAYTGKHLDVPQLMAIVPEIFIATVMESVTLIKASVNSFIEEKTGKERHDVLISVNLQTQELIEQQRVLLRKCYSQDHSKFFMREPHVTAKICSTKEEAMVLRNLINEKLPFLVTITGVTID